MVLTLLEDFPSVRLTSEVRGGSGLTNGTSGNDAAGRVPVQSIVSLLWVPVCSLVDVGSVAKILFLFEGSGSSLQVGMSPVHGCGSALHASLSVVHFGKSPSHTGGCPSHTGGSLVHFGKSPSHTGGFPVHFGRSLPHTGGFLVHSGRSSSHTGGSPVHAASKFFTL